MMKETFKRGFTLIELLVVIAIIGILAAVVLASLNDARDSAQDTSIKQSIGNIRSQAELIYNREGYSYAGVCTDSNGQIQRLMTAAADNRAETTGTQVDAASSATLVTCNDDATGYAVVAPLNLTLDPDDPTTIQAWCVDSTGFAGTTTPGALSAGTDVTCN